MAGTLSFVQSTNIGSPVYGKSHDSKRIGSGLANRTIKNSVQVQGLRISSAPSLAFSGADFHSKVAISIAAPPGGRASRCVARAMSSTTTYDRFTEKSINVIIAAQDEARRLDGNFVGTEQILLGLIREETGIAAEVLKSAGITLKDARLEVEKIIGRGSGFVAVEIPFTPRAKRVLELACRIGHKYVGTEHLLLGLLHEDEGVAVRVIKNLGADPENIRAQLVIQMVNGKSTEAVGDCVGGSSTNNKMPTLEEYLTKVTKMDDKGKLDPGVWWIEHVKQTSVQWHIKVILQAREEARWFSHNFVGTEHILLALMGEGTGIAAKAFKSLGINLKDARTEVEKITRTKRGGGFVVELAYTPRATRVLKHSLKEARQLGHDNIGSEHLLLGLLCEGEGVAVRVLENLGADPNNIRSQIIQMVNECTESVGDGLGGGKANSKMPALEENGANKTKLAEEGKLDLVVGWVAQIDQVMQTSAQWHIKFILRAHEEARRLGHIYVCAAHILLALIGEKTGIAATVFKNIGINLNDARVELEKVIGRGPGFVDINLPPQSKCVLEYSGEEARKLGHNYIGSEHLLLGLLREGEGVVACVLKNLGADPNNIQTQVLQMVGESTEAVSDGVRGGSTKSKMSTLEEYGTNIVKLAEEGKLDPGVGWVSLVQRVMQTSVQWPITVIMRAQDEARWLGHNYVGTEQILLGLIGEETGIAAKVLNSMGINLNDARVEVEKIIGRRGGFMAVEIPFNPGAKRALELSLEEARQLGLSYIGSEHLLLGLLREGECVAVRVLEKLGANPNEIRTQVIQMVGESSEAA
ncbi:hypothetical protein MKX03_009908 [Papaver bracteatum]|nr:hypothetical protein MKX03_009908 [Papaver bracteatum]